MDMKPQKPGFCVSFCFVLSGGLGGKWARRRRTIQFCDEVGEVESSEGVFR